MMIRSKVSFEGKSMMKLIRSMCLLVAAALFNGCASGPEPTKEPPLGPPDTLELLHRARFRDLVDQDPNRIERLEPSLASPGASDVESFSDWLARSAYREGDGRAAKEALAMLGTENRTR